MTAGCNLYVSGGASLPLPGICRPGAVERAWKADRSVARKRQHRGRPRCSDAADANDDGEVDIADTAFALSFLFSDGEAPPAPYPEIGFDPTADSLDCAAGD